MTQPKEVRFEITDELRPVFSDFNTLAIVRGLRPLDAYAELVRQEVEANRHELEGRWLPWKDFETAMLHNGFSVNRVTIWNYRKNGDLDNLVRTDGKYTLYNLDGFLAFYRGETAAV